MGQRAVRTLMAFVLSVGLGAGLTASPTVAGPFEDGIAAYEKQDYGTAFKVWKPLAKKGHPQVLFNYAAMYANGEGVKQDYAIAVQWLQRAIDKGHRQALLVLGVYYYWGRGVARDYAKARALRAGVQARPCRGRS